MPEPGSGRRRRLAEELEEAGMRLGDTAAHRDVLLDEIDHARRPVVHERRVASIGTIVEPMSDPATWGPGTGLDITRIPAGRHPLPAVRRFADGLSSWVLRHIDGSNEWLVFDRPAGSERDMVVMAGVFDATLVQRHPAEAVRIAGGFGVLRWQGLWWHHEPPVRSWIDAVAARPGHGDARVLEALLEFAVHDLGALGIGSLLVYRPDAGPGPQVEEMLPTPPPLRIREPFHLGPLRHALSQVDGAAVFDATGILRRLGVRLMPSQGAERDVAAYRGTRHTSGRRYSRDDPVATVIAVSEDGPVTVFRDGTVIGRSADADEGPA
jgi:Probable sensor domain DACNK/DisA bacterial checkpoint controller nucleotide-binding